MASIDASRLDFTAFRRVALQLDPSHHASDDEAALRRRFNELNPTNDGFVYLQDYKLTLLFEALQRHSAAMLQSFTTFDIDGDGGLDVSEFTEALLSIGIDKALCGEKEIDLVFSHVDADGSGRISAEELMDFGSESSFRV